jgi:DNA-directed RNA polymerase specialized sigma24 family protein
MIRERRLFQRRPRELFGFGLVTTPILKLNNSLDHPARSSEDSAPVRYAAVATYTHLPWLVVLHGLAAEPANADNAMQTGCVVPRLGLLPMSAHGSVTSLIRLLKDGDHEAAQRLWELYFQRVVDLARSRLRNLPRRAADEEDVALSAFDSFLRGARHGRFPRLEDRDDLWQLLLVLTVRKAANLAHHECRLRRGAGQVRALADLAGMDLERIAGSEPTPELAALVADECRELLARLGEQTLRSVAVWKMEGFTNCEIAARLGCVPQTVERKLRAIRRIWAEETAP